MFGDLMADMDAAIQDTFSTKGVLNDAYVVDVVIDQNVIRINDFGESIQNSYEVTFFSSQVETLKIGNTVDVKNDRYTLTAPVQGDGSIVIWAANVTR